MDRVRLLYLSSNVRVTKIVEGPGTTPKETLSPGDTTGNPSILTDLLCLQVSGSYGAVDAFEVTTTKRRIIVTRTSINGVSLVYYMRPVVSPVS